MPQVLAFISVALIGIVTVTYAYNIITGKTKPVLATWILFAIVTWLSLISYYFSGAHSVAGNIMNITDVVMCSLFMILVIAKNKSASLRFTKFELVCLGLSAVILIFWVVSREHFIANLLLQLVLTIAYFPTLVGLWKATTTPEPLLIWMINWTATFSGFAAALLRYDTLGSVYAFRALILMGALILLIARINKYKNRQSAV